MRYAFIGVSSAAVTVCVCVQEAQVYAEENSLLFMETSAKTAMNVNEIFLAIGESEREREREREEGERDRVTILQPRSYPRLILPSNELALVVGGGLWTLRKSSSPGREAAVAASPEPNLLLLTLLFAPFVVYSTESII